nr:unnamed protein product [Callosobruchus chinensis]
MSIPGKSSPRKLSLPRLEYR